MINIWKTAGPQRFAAAFAALILVGGLTVAGHASAKTQILTQETVKQFIASFPAVRTIAVSHAVDKGKTIASTKNHLAAVIEAVSDKSIAAQVNQAVKPHGFKDAKEWAAVGESVGRVYAHLKLGTEDGKAKKKLDKALGKLEKSDFLNDKQKEKLAKALRGGADEALEPPPEENVKAVKPMVAELEAVVK